MSGRLAVSLLASLLGTAAPSAQAAEIVIDFEQAQIGKPTPSWTEQGVVFALAEPLRSSKATGRIMFFPHLTTHRKGILNAMATEQAIPLQATLPVPASAVTLVLWGSTGCPAQVEALDANGRVVDRASVAAVPGRKTPADPVPFLELTVRAPGIAAIRISGPRNGEFLATDEIRITTAGVR
jgi:hypothetical protein